jgi:hypothetical protein
VPFRQRNPRDEFEDRTRVFSVAFVFAHKAIPIDAFDRWDVVVLLDKSGEVWVDLRQSNVLTVLGYIERGQGRLVVRCWYFFSKSGQLEQAKRRGDGGYDHDAILELHERLCDAGNSLAGSGASSRAGSPWGSLRSGAGSPDSGHLRVCNDGVWRVCNECHAGHTCVPCRPCLPDAVV